jgi:hypothetical protein
MENNMMEALIEDSSSDSDGCGFEATLTVGDRGQIVLPKSIREKMGLIHGEYQNCLLSRFDEIQRRESGVRELLSPLLEWFRY